MGVPADVFDLAIERNFQSGQLRQSGVARHLLGELVELFFIGQLRQVNLELLERGAVTREIVNKRRFARENLAIKNDERQDEHSEREQASHGEKQALQQIPRHVIVDI